MFLLIAKFGIKSQVARSACAHSACVVDQCSNYSKLKGTPNLTSMAEAGKPSTVGKKAAAKGIKQDGNQARKKDFGSSNRGRFTRRTLLSTADDSDSPQILSRDRSGESTTVVSSALRFSCYKHTTVWGSGFWKQ